MLSCDENCIHIFPAIFRATCGWRNSLNNCTSSLYIFFFFFVCVFVVQFKNFKWTFYLYIHLHFMCDVTFRFELQWKMRWECFSWDYRWAKMHTQQQWTSATACKTNRKMACCSLPTRSHSHFSSLTLGCQLPEFSSLP